CRIDCLCRWTPGVAPKAKSDQCLQQRFGVHEIRRCETFRECAVHGAERGAGLVRPAVPLLEAGETYGGTQLPRPALLTPGYLNGLAEPVLGRADLIVP